MRKDKYSENEKRLCQAQENLVKNHVKACSICKKSFDEYDKFGVSVTPPCQKFVAQIDSHIKSCIKCQEGNKKWNEDAIPIIPEMRELVGNIKSGNWLSLDPSKIKKVVSHLTEKLELTSNEIKDLHDNAEKKAREGLGHA